MAVRIPTYESRLTPSGQGIQARASGVQVSDAIGRGLQNLGQTVTNITETIHKDITEAKVREADNQVSDAIRGIMYNPTDGFLTKTGKDAVNASADVEKKLRELKDKVGGTLQNKDQQRMFEDIFNRRLESTLNSVTSHTAQQAKVFNKAEAAARVEMAIQDGISNYADPEAFKTARATALQESVYDLQGAPAEVAARAALTKLHTGVISQMLAQDRPSLARKWFADNQYEIDPTQHDAIMKALQAGSLKEDSLNLSFELQATSSNFTTQQKELKKRYQDGTISAELYDATQQRLDKAFNDKEQSQAVNTRALIGRAENFLIKNPNASVLDLPTNDYNALMNTGNLSAIVAFAKSGRYITDPKAVQEIMSLSPDELSKMTEDQLYTKYRARLDDTDLNVAFARLNNSKGTATPQHLEILNTNDRVEGAAVNLGILPAKGLSAASGDQQKAYDSFRQDINNRIIFFESTIKRKATNEELQKILDDSIKDKVNVPGIWWGSNTKPAISLTAQQAQTAFVQVGNENILISSIPTAQRQMIITELMKRNKPVTQQAIAELWVAAGKQR